ncbi:MAG: Phosphoribosylamine--glycine ligase [Alphaproteobacteria bacterium MarineAlpha6_Bin3]|nr:MAG: Phosphoribosylamine--glycine ligase [Alphaproteobacteria bacterium MarineAlpha6_Bin3]
MRVLVLGSGGREHALCWAISKSTLCKKLFCAPGNAGIKEIAECKNLNIKNFNSIKNFIKKEKINFVVVGPEEPLVNGIVDKLNKIKVKAFGPNKRAAILESSKSFTKDFCKRNNIPTASYKKFKNFTKAENYINKLNYPIVIKASGLAGGKGVFIIKNKAEARKTLINLMIKKEIGHSGKEVIVEDYLIGEEISCLALVDGKNYIPLLLSQDHKKIYENDKGPNTGGMGAYCPLPYIKRNIQDQINKEIIEPTIRAMNKENRMFNGILYAGLMLVGKKIYLIEFNVRFGDPECQPLIFLLKSDLLKILINCTNKKLSKTKIKWKREYALSVVMVNKGYPGKYKNIGVIKNLNLVAKKRNVKVFHSGTSLNNKNDIIASGGRVLSVTASDKNFNVAKKNAYQIVKKIKWQNSFFRRDIGFRAKKMK